MVTAYCGANKVGSIPIDLVVGAVITQTPDSITPVPRLGVPGFALPDYRLYPIVDHIADKLCATVERHGPAGRPSSRPRDMVDLVVIARTQTVRADELWAAIEAERQHRELPPIAAYRPPDTWRRLYPREARSSVECRHYATFESATALIGRFLDPVLDGSVADRAWTPARGWVEDGRED